MSCPRQPFHFFILLAAVLPAAVAAGDVPSFDLTLHDHRFEPAELEVPAGQKIRLVVKNEDSTPEEFESKSLKREKIVNGKGQIVLNLGPLAPGSHEFVGEFHESTARGRLIVR